MNEDERCVDVRLGVLDSLQWLSVSWIRLNDVAKGYEQKLILREVFFRLAAGDRVGLIGRNGAGKTTLLHLLLGREAPDSGTVDVTPGTRIGYFSQFSELDGDRSIREELESLFGEIRLVEAELGDIGAALSLDVEEQEMHRLVDRQAALLEQMETGGGWTYHQHIDTALSMLGFDAERCDLPVAKLSGGWLNRAALAKILLQSPDVLLLDEPTNFLDVAGIAWLERWLRDFRGAVLTVSHDRHFLEQVVTSIVEIENLHLQTYVGSYSDYVRQKAGSSEEPRTPVQQRAAAAGLRAGSHRRPQGIDQEPECGAQASTGEHQEERQPATRRHDHHQRLRRTPRPRRPVLRAGPLEEIR